MAPLVKVTPTLIDGTSFAANSKVTRGVPGSGSASCDPGLKRWVFNLSGTVFFMVLQNATDQSQLTGAGGLFMSLDSGVTWTRQDAAHQPALGAGLSCYYPGGSTIYVAFSDAGGHLFNSTINLTTTGATWGTASVQATGGLVWGATTGTLHITRLSSGDVYLYYTIQTGGAKEVGYQSKYSGGAWSLPVVITTNVAATFCEMATVISDSSDQTLVLWTESSAGNIVVLCRSIDATGALGIVQTIFNNAQFSALGGFLSAGAPVIYKGNFQIPVFFGVPSTQMQMLTGTPLPTPVWTLSTAVDPGGSTVPAGGAQLFGPFGSIVDKNGLLWAFWIVANSIHDATPQQIWANSFGSGGWGTPVLVYDYALNQPGSSAIGSGLGQYILDMSVEAGSFLIQATMPLSAGQSVAGFSMLAAPPTAIVNITLGLKGMKVYPQA